jgi:hypothetical protein
MVLAAEIGMRLRGALNITVVVLAMAGISLLALGPATALCMLLVPRRFYRMWTSWAVSLWLGLCAATTEGLFGTKYFVTGDRLEAEASLLMLSGSQ